MRRAALSLALSALALSAVSACRPGPDERQAERQAAVDRVVAAIRLEGTASADAAPESDRAHVHLAAIASAWHHIRRTYPYDDEFARKDWSEALEWAVGETLTLHGTPTSDGERERLFFRILRHLVARSRDGQAFVTSPHGADADYRPPVVCRLVEGHVIVTGPATGPVPIVPGDEIIRIEGVGPRLKMSYVADLISGTTERHVLHRAANESLSGPRDTLLNLRVMAHGKRPRYVMVRRTQEPANRAGEVRPAPIAEVAPGILYVGVGRVTDADVSRALPRMAVARGIVFDFREEPRGLSIRRSILPHLLDAPATSVPFDYPVARNPGHDETKFSRRTWTVAPEAPRLKARVAFLADAGVVGEREAILALVRQYRLGEIVGEPTGGTPGDTDRADLPGGYLLTWTAVKARQYDGTRGDGTEVAPTVAASLTREGLREGRDDILQKAVADLQRSPRAK